MGSLTALQTDLLHRWFSQSQDFFLTGGAALIAFYGAPRSTDDVDLFTSSEAAFATANDQLLDTCQKIGATAEVLRAAPHFRRYRVRRGDEETVADLVCDLAPQLHSLKEKRPNGILADAEDEILVNKICALVGRQEPRDYYDVWYLSTRGLDVDRALQQATIKDAGATPETLVFILQGIRWEHFHIPDLPGPEVAEVAAFFQAWCQRLAVQLFPTERPG
ncbi:MAG: nucleotidyl transferase AbiEii/AbiGii toxin family protein [Candidatus Xenobia bacterium]